MIKILLKHGGVRVTAMRPKYAFAPHNRDDSQGDTQGDTHSSCKKGGVRPQSWPQSTENKVLSLLFFGDMSRKQLSDKLRIAMKANSLREALDQLMRLRFVKYTIPEKPNSRLQKYHLTEEGLNHILRQNAEVPH